MVAVASFLNYVDRQTLSLLAGPVQRDLGINDLGYANLVTAFLAAYTIGNLVTAWLVVRLGARRGLALFVGWWSLACLLGGVAQNAVQLGITRFALGLGETGNWTAAPVLVRQWFPAQDRGTAIGIYTAAAMIGATLAPPLITTLGLEFGWRSAFWVTGAVGLVWVVAWLKFYGRRLVPDTSLAGSDDLADAREDDASWRSVLLDYEVWAIAVAGMFASPVWYFYLFWFPKYLTGERGISLAYLGRTAWVVYLAAGLGALTGGILSSILIRWGFRPVRARLAVMALAALTATVGAANAAAPAIAISLSIAALVGFAHFLWTSNITALAVDLFPSQTLGKVFGVMGVLSGLAGIVTTYLIALLVESLSYKPMFVVMSAAYVLALFAVATILIKPAQTEPLNIR